VAERGRCNNRSGWTGLLAAVLGLEDAQVVAVCAPRMELFEAVNFNSLVRFIAGNRGGRKCIAFNDGSGQHLVLYLCPSVSHPTCSLMKPAADKLAEVGLNGISDAKCTCLQCSIFAG